MAPHVFFIDHRRFRRQICWQRTCRNLLSVLKNDYTVSDDWEGAKCAGIDLDWDYANRQVHMSMPGYCREALTRFGHQYKRHYNQPHRHELPVYVPTVQYAKKEDTSPKLNDGKKKFAQ